MGPRRPVFGNVLPEMCFLCIYVCMYTCVFKIHICVYSTAHVALMLFTNITHGMCIL